MHHWLFNDSKTFVDKPLRESPKEVYLRFLREFPQDVKKIDRQRLQAFVDTYFEEEGTELVTCELTDWLDSPPRLATIRDHTMRQWALDLNNIWRSLCRQVDKKVLSSPERHSLIYVPEPFVVPGGRFREYYYWDAYWIIRGLLASGMTETSKRIIKNFLYVVDKYGMIPNGGRIYYIRRSQPPLLAGMLYEYYEATRDKNFIAEALPLVEKELQFWEANRQVIVNVGGQNYTVFQYRAASNAPRSESYREDISLTKNVTDVHRKRRIWRDIASAAESGWDFGSRWFADGKRLQTIETTNVVPVDLNAFICWNMDILSYLYDQVGNDTKSQEYHVKVHEFRRIFDKVFYVDAEDGWYDFNLRTGRHNLEYYASNGVPLFARCYKSMNREKSERLYNKMEQMGVLDYPGGVPSSLNDKTGEQWDFPNGWSPMNHMIIDGLRRASNPRMQEKAYWMAHKWIISNYEIYNETQLMWEKYDVAQGTAKIGGGGEYVVQAGYGWTNGVILDLLTTYADRFTFPGKRTDGCPTAGSVIGRIPPVNSSSSITRGDS